MKDEKDWIKFSPFRPFRRFRSFTSLLKAVRATNHWPSSNKRWPAIHASIRQIPFHPSSPFPHVFALLQSAMTLIEYARSRKHTNRGEGQGWTCLSCEEDAPCAVRFPSAVQKTLLCRLWRHRSQAQGTTLLHGVPDLVDVTTLSQVLQTLGMHVERQSDGTRWHCRLSMKNAAWPITS